MEPSPELTKAKTMKPNRLLPIACAILLAGCHFGSFWDFRSPIDHARDNASRCAGYTVEKDAALFAPASVEKVEPAITHVASGPIQDEARLRGALIHLGPSPSLTRELIQRAVECHEVHVLLGTESELPYDPYTLSGTWLDIDAESEGDGFTVAIRSDQFPIAKQVLERARRFVASNR